jgi:hypothetical protein
VTLKNALWCHLSTMKKILFATLCFFANDVLAQKNLCKKFTEKNLDTKYSYVYEYDRQGAIVTLTTYDSTQTRVGFKRYLRSSDTIRVTNYDEHDKVIQNGIQHLFLLDTQSLVRKEIITSRSYGADGLLWDWLTDTIHFEYNHLKQCIAYKRMYQNCSITSRKDTSCSSSAIAGTHTYKKGDKQLDFWQSTDIIVTNGEINSIKTVSGTQQYTYKRRPLLRFDPLACNQVKCTRNTHALQKIDDFDPKTNAKRLNSWYKPIFNKQGDVIQNTLYYYADEARTQIQSNRFSYEYEFYP